MQDSIERWEYIKKKNIKRKTNWFRKKYIRGCNRLFNYGPVKRYYANRKIISRKNTNLRIAELIDSGKPFVVSRFGNTEISNIMCWHEEMFRDRLSDKRVWNSLSGEIGEFEKVKSVWNEKIAIFSGFFPNDEENIDKFVNLNINCFGEIDLLATWDLYMEEYYIETYMPQTELTHLYYIEPWFYKNPWSKGLENKKVLIIHPFVDTITSQYKNHREQIFKNSDVLPLFELKTLKAVQTIAGTSDKRFSSWFDALEYMYNEAMKIDFDIAILGCGAYGMPLAVKLKRAGKQAIHLGGATQILFGIKGKRWEAKNFPEKTARLFNEYWVRPDESERVQNQQKVEDSCYW